MFFRKLKVHVDNLIRQLTYRQKFIFLAVVFIFSAYTPGFWLFRTLELFSAQNALKLSGQQQIYQLNLLALAIAEDSISHNDASLQNVQLRSSISLKIENLALTDQRIEELKKSDIMNGKTLRIPFDTNIELIGALWQDILTQRSKDALPQLYLRILKEIQQTLMQTAFSYDANLTSSQVNYVLAKAMMVDNIQLLQLFVQSNSPNTPKQTQLAINTLLKRSIYSMQSELIAGISQGQSLTSVETVYMQSSLDKVAAGIRAYLGNQDAANSLAFLTSLRNFVDLSNKALIENTSYDQKKLDYLWWSLVLFLSFGTFHALFYSLFHVLSSHLLKLVHYVEEITQGNFNVPIRMNTSDSVGKIALAISSMGRSLGSFVSDLVGVGEEMQTFIKKVSILSQKEENLFGEQNHQLMLLEQTNKEMGQKSKNLANDISSIINQSEEKDSNFQDHNKLHEVQHNMQQLVNSSEGIKNALDLLQAHVTKAIRLITLITKVSDEAHLLALNASLEMLNTGEERPVFSQVTESIRLFAETSKASTEQIQKIIDNMVHHVTNARHVTKTCIAKINAGLNRLLLVSQQISQISDENRKQTHKFQEINHLIQAQADSVQTIIATLSELTLGAKSNTEAIKSLENALVQLGKHTDEFNNVLNQFSSPREQIEEALP